MLLGVTRNPGRILWTTILRGLLMGMLILRVKTPGFYHLGEEGEAAQVTLLDWRQLRLHLLDFCIILTGSCLMVLRLMT